MYTMNAELLTSHIFFIFLFSGCLGLFVKECMLNIKIMCLPNRDTEITCLSENDIYNDIV